MTTTSDKGSDAAALVMQAEGAPDMTDRTGHNKHDVVLVAVDFEEASTKALSMAHDLATRLDAEIVLVHVCPQPIYAYAGIDGTALGAFAQVTAVARESLETLAAVSGNVDAILREGDPAQEILGVAEEVDPTMIVMGTHGRHGLAHWLLGSVAEKVVRGSKVPVLTVRA